MVTVRDASGERTLTREELTEGILNKTIGPSTEVMSEEICNDQRWRVLGTTAFYYAILNVGPQSQRSATSPSAPAARFCSNCGAALAAGARFCAACGAAVAVQGSVPVAGPSSTANSGKKYEFCGAGMTEDALRCPSCKSWLRDIRNKMNAIRTLGIGALIFDAMWLWVIVTAARERGFGSQDEYMRYAFGSSASLLFWGSLILILIMITPWYQVGKRTGMWWWF